MQVLWERGWIVMQVNKPCHHYTFKGKKDIFLNERRIYFKDKKDIFGNP